MTAMDLASLDTTQTVRLLLTIPGLGVAGFWRLHGLVEDIREAFFLPRDQLLSVLAPKVAEELLNTVHNSHASSHIQRFMAHGDLLDRLETHVIDFTHPDYPPLLAEVDNRPPLLFCRGNPECLSDPQLAIVGSRHASRGGLNNSWRFANTLAEGGMVITSGLALGIDAAAHQGCLEAEGRTLAVMGTGIDWIYPRRHEQLANDILRRDGALVTEFFPGTVPQPGNFPRRNRLISGLSLGVLVIEAALKSGSLITARYALEQNREVFALPGSIHNPASRGCHALIREGATLVESVADIFDQLQAWLPPAGNTASKAMLLDGKSELSGQELAVWELLDYDPAPLESLMQQSPLTVSELLTSLTALELKGLVEQQSLGYLRLQSC